MIRIIAVVILVIATITGGIAWMQHHEKAKIEERIETYKPLVAKEINDHYNVDKIDFTDHVVTPMGTIILHGYVNGDKELSFAAPLNKKADGTYNSNGFGLRAGLNDLAK